jgi:predicted Ser/Thr protein kinase
MAICASCGTTLASPDAICSRCGETRFTEVAVVEIPERNGYVPGTLLADRYRIVALLGRGGMGEVYRADDLTLGQQVALKFLPAALSRKDDALRRFRNEVRIARQVSHPNVCRVYDLGEVDGAVFLSMEYVDGEDLATLLRRIGRLPSDKGLEIARKLCAGLAAAHEKGVLHRDLKPGNVMLDARGQVRLTDFGLAGLSEEIEGAEIRSGTPAYMAPEQLTGKEVTVRSDIYALGLVLYELFTGKRPFEGDSLQELIRLRSESAPETPASLVRDLDPAVEAVILRCLEPNPASRLPSAFAVAAAFPGGDPIADALAAGETPSPQMIAAAGEGEGLAPTIAIPVFAAVLIGCIVTAAMAIRTSALERIQPEFPPEVLAQKAKDLVSSAGYNSRPADTAHGFFWYRGLVGYIGEKDRPHPLWNQILAGSPSVLRYWYRQSDVPLVPTEFHSDLLIPGEVTGSDPPPITSGMVAVTFDARGGLVRFEAVPPQLLESAGSQNSPTDWAPFFKAAGLDPAKLQPAEPLWTWLATSDHRAAWTGTWPGTSRSLRVETASLQGRAVAFALLGPWDKPDRIADAGGDWKAGIRTAIYGLLLIGICVASAWLARRNLAAGRGDRRGALRLAVFIFIVHISMWLTTSHIVLTSLLGMSLLALCTALFYGLILWTVYLALEPYVRRHWPRTLISWSKLLAGQWRDPIVGRDVLLGAALGVAWTMTGRLLDLVGGGVHEPRPTWTDENLLMGTKDAIGAWLERGPHHLRDGLLFFSLLFLLRVVLRNQWLGAAAFVTLLTVPVALQTEMLGLGILAGLVIYGLAALVVLRYGLLALTMGFCVSGLIGPPLSLHTGAWYFGNIAFLFGSAILIAAWAFYSSVGGRRFWSSDPFV